MYVIGGSGSIRDFQGGVSSGSSKNLAGQGSPGYSLLFYPGSLLSTRWQLTGLFANPVNSSPILNPSVPFGLWVSYYGFRDTFCSPDLRKEGWILVPMKIWAPGLKRYFRG